MASLAPYLFLLFSLGAMGQKLERLSVFPFDLENKETFEFPGSVNQIEYVDGTLYLRSEREAFLTLAKPSGQILKNIGRQGEGPGEFGGALKAMAIGHGHFFALASSPLDRLHHFSGDEYLSYIPVLALRATFISGSSSKKIDVSATHVVLPAPPQSGFLGFAYDFHEKKIPVGSLIYGKKSVSTLEQNPLINDTLWQYEKPYWFAVLRYENLILKFDEDFKMVDSFQLSHPRLEALKEDVSNYDRAKFTYPPSLYHDVDYWDNFLYLLLRKTLLKVNPQNGSIERMYTFHGEGPDFVNGPSAELYFSTFAIIEDGVAVLGARNGFRSRSCAIFEPQGRDKMKLVSLVILFCLLTPFTLSDSCTASPTGCSEQCAATAGPGQNVDCFEDANSAECCVFDNNGFLISQETVNCNSSGGAGGGGANGGGGDGGSDGCINTMGCWPWLL